MYIVAYLTINSQQGDLPMLNALKKLFGMKSAEVTQPEAAPYKIETPVVVEPTPVVEQASQVMIESVAPAKKPRAKKSAASKKPRKPNAPKQS